MTDANDKPRKYRFERIVEAVKSVLPENENESMALRRQRNTVVAGCVLEMATVQPSRNELSKHIDATHVQIEVLLVYWWAMPWQDRYGWLRLVEGRLSHAADAVDAPLL